MGREKNPAVSKPEITCFMKNLDFWGKKKEQKQFSIVELQTICSNASKTSATIPYSNLDEQAFLPIKPS